MARRDEKKRPAANRLRDQAEPNKLSWTGADAAEGDIDAELEGDEAGLDDDLEYDEDEDLEVEDPETLARRRAELEEELARQAEEFGLTGTNPTAAYGENGEAVAALLDRLDRVGPEQMEHLADAWDAVDPAERAIVLREVARKHRGGRHRDELAAAEQMVTDWLSSSVREDEGGAALVRTVAAAATDAIDALILDRELDDADFDTLFGPWSDVMENEDGEETAAEEPEGGAEPGEDAGDEGPFGPNTGLIREFLVRLAALDPDQLSALSAAWSSLSKADLRQAHRAVQDLAKEDETWRGQVRAAQEEVSKWADSPHPARPGRKGVLLPPDPEIIRAAIPAAVDAITALVLADLLDPDDADTLYAAWDEVVGEPELPEFEEDELDT